MEGCFLTGLEEETEALGARLGAALRRRDAVLLDAPLGTGKTAFARGLIRAAGGGPEVPSPTFAIVQPYDTDPPIFHLDLYRLEDFSEVEELGVDDMLSDGIVLVEWPEKAAGFLPEDAVVVRGEVLEDGRRRWNIRRGGRS